MKIQSLSIDVPVKKCVNNCAYCVSHLHTNPYPEKIDWPEIKKRMQFAVNNGCNTVILTGRGEPQQNVDYLQQWHIINQSLSVPFLWIELQTTGVFCKYPDQLRFLKSIGITTISLSISDLFDTENNQKICGTPDKLKVDIESVCDLIHSFDFNLRLSLNMISTYSGQTFFDIIARAIDLHANQITFRELYSIGNNLEIINWIQQNKLPNDEYKLLLDACIYHATPIEILPYGSIVYDYNGISIVFDKDCMAIDLKHELKYLILRPNSKLYTKWDTPASLKF